MRIPLLDRTRRFLAGALIIHRLWRARRPWYSKVVHFVFVGFITLPPEYALLYLLVTTLGIPLWFSNALVSGLNFVLNFLLQKKVTFEDINPERVWRQFREFMVKSAILFALDAVSVPVIVKMTGIWYLWVKIATMPVFGALSLVLSILIFHRE